MAVSSTSMAGDSHYGVSSAFDSSSRWRRPGSVLAGLSGAETSAGTASEQRGRPSSASDFFEQGAPATDEAMRAPGREKLLSQLAAEAAPRGFRIAWDLLGDRDEAEDAVQEALARACEQSHRIRETQAISAWFYRVLTNQCMRTLRRRRLRRLFFGTRDPADEARPTAAREPGPDRQLAHRREVTQLLQAMDDLPAKQRTALLLRYGHELSITEIADMLAVRPATVKTHLVRGLRRLRKVMENKQ